MAEAALAAAALAEAALAAAALAAAALAAAAAEWLRQRWLRQRRRLVSGGLGLCFCGFLAEAAAATETGSAGCGSGGDLCLAASACVSAALWLRQRWLRQRRRLVSGVLGLCFCGFLAVFVAARRGLWLRQRWLRQRRRLVSGLGLCFSQPWCCLLRLILAASCSCRVGPVFLSAEWFINSSFFTS
jgi:hypothetical protein